MLQLVLLVDMGACRFCFDHEQACAVLCFAVDRSVGRLVSRSVVRSFFFPSCFRHLYSIIIARPGWVAVSVGDVRRRRR